MNPFQDWLVDQAWNVHPVLGVGTLVFLAWQERKEDDD
jgi:hypothetical protein